VKTIFTEHELESATLSWFEALGYKILHGPDIAPGELFAERESYQEPHLPRRYAAAIAACPLNEGFFIGKICVTNR
jgi:type I restriction enzyme R subunit